VVQVDVFWGFAFGGTLGVAASRQLRARRELATADRGGASGAVTGAAEETTGGRGRRVPPLTENPYFLKTVLYLALLFGPSGLYLIWQFPSWETMHAATEEYDSLPAWLVTAFGITNVTQGILAFWIVDRLVARGRTYLAFVTGIVVPYMLFFFTLVHGWDGKGYQRFFSPTHEDFVNWDGDWSAFLGSDVAVTLYVMGLVMLPVLGWLYVSWMREGYRIGGRFTPHRRKLLGGGALFASIFVAAFGLGLGPAIVASLIIHQLGWIAGGLVSLALIWVAVLRPGALASRMHDWLALTDPASDAALAESRPAPVTGRRVEVGT
jgi:hypothetical protein